MKKAFTLVEIAIVILVISILMVATMRFGSNRIVDLKAQSVKEQFVGRYNELYTQNMTSSFRDGKQYALLIITLTQTPYYMIDQLPITDPKLTEFELKNIRFSTDSTALEAVNLFFVPYQLGCLITDGKITGDVVYFDLFVKENGKQYCFEIPSETCKLIEIKCK